MPAISPAATAIAPSRPSPIIAAAGPGHVPATAHPAPNSALPLICLMRGRSTDQPIGSPVMTARTPATLSARTPAAATAMADPMTRKTCGSRKSSMLRMTAGSESRAQDMANPAPAPTISPVNLAFTMSSSDSVGENRHALHAPFRGRALGIVGVELVLGIGLDLVDAQPGCLDRRTIIVLLRRAANACCPEIRVTHDALRQGRLGDDVGNGQTSATLEKTRGFLKDSVLVGREIDHAV